MALLNRSTFRKALAVLIDANANFKKVYNHIPNLDTTDAVSPICMVRSGGSDTDMLSQHTNPSDFHVLVRIAVILNDSEQGGTWTEDNAEDKIDELDQIIRQIVRDNVGGVGGMSTLKINGLSDSGYAIIGGEDYRIEEYTVIGHHPAGE